MMDATKDERFKEYLEELNSILKEAELFSGTFALFRKFG